jgi:uncharacterized protein (DUF433 family)
MAETTRIVTTEGILGGEPRISDTRVGIRDVYALAVEGDHSPVDVADQLDISVGAVHTALAYYYEHPAEMRALEQQHAESEQQLATRSVRPPQPAE